MFPSLAYAAWMLQVIGPSPAPPPQKPPTEWVVFVAAPVYQPDGGLAAETVALPGAGPGLVHLFSRRTICEPAVGGATEPPDAAFGWRIASQILSRSDRDVVVSLNWRRLWEDGRKIQNGPGSTVQLTLHQGDRIPLDLIANSKPRPECRAVGLGLEVRLAESATLVARRTPVLPLGATPGGAKPVDAELWLLHTSPSDVQQVVHQTVRLPAEGGRFGFAPTSLSSARGTASVELSGSIDRYRTPTGDEYLLLSLTRRVRGTGLPPEGVTATTGSIVSLPQPAEVLAFEMPGTGATRGGGGGGAVLRGGSGGVAAGAIGAQGVPRTAGGRGGAGGAAGQLQVAALLEGHQLALRLRIVPVN
jgi:hypothetical protein